MVSGSAPNTLFGVIPAGRTEISQPLNRVSRVAVTTRFSPAALLLAGILVLIALTASGFFWLLAAIVAATSYRTRLTITDSGGGTQDVDVSPLDRAAVEGFASQVNEHLAAQ